IKPASLSRDSHPKLARVVSPGFGVLPPPPTRACLEVVWWTERIGRRDTATPSLSRAPEAEYTLVSCTFSSPVKGGRIPGSALASRDFPSPGGPIRRRLCPPAAAIQAAPLAVAWPRISPKSTAGGTTLA